MSTAEAAAPPPTPSSDAKRPESQAQSAPAQPNLPEQEELRCTICGLRACWTK